MAANEQDGITKSPFVGFRESGRFNKDPRREGVTLARGVIQDGKESRPVILKTYSRSHFEHGDDEADPLGGETLAWWLRAAEAQNQGHTAAPNLVARVMGCRLEAEEVHVLVTQAQNSLRMFTKGNVPAGPHLRRIVASVVAGLRALRDAGGRAHGNLRLNNVLVRESGRGGYDFLLSDPEPCDPALLSEREDLRALGRILLQLGSEESEPNEDEQAQGQLDRERVSDWRSRFGAEAEEWLALCNRLLFKNDLTLDELASDPKFAAPAPSRRTGPPRPLVLIGAAVVLLIVAIVLIEKFRGRPDDTTEVSGAGPANTNMAGGTTVVTQVIVLPPNEPPVVNAYSNSVMAGRAIDIRLSAHDPEGASLIFTFETEGLRGRLSGTGPEVTFTSLTSAIGPTGFRYIVSDGTNRATSSVQIVVLAPPALNMPPIAYPTNVSVAAGGTIEIHLRAEDAERAALTFKVDDTGLQGTRRGEGPKVSYTAPTNALGRTGFRYTVSDGTNSANSTVEITFLPPIITNQPPTVSAANFTMKWGRTNTIALPGVDPEKSALTFQVYSNGMFGTISGTSSNRMYVAPKRVGIDKFQFSASDGSLQSARETVTINVTNIRPVAKLIPPAAVVAGGSVSLGLGGQDEDQDRVAVRIVTFPKQGSLDTNTWVYTARDQPLEKDAEDQFNYVVNDGLEDSTGSVVRIVVKPRQPINNPPMAGPSSVPVVYASDRLEIPVSFPASDPDAKDRPLLKIVPSGLGLQFGDLVEETAGKWVYKLRKIDRNVPLKNPFLGGKKEMISYVVTDPSQATAKGTVTLEFENVTMQAIKREYTIEYFESFPFPVQALVRYDPPSVSNRVVLAFTAIEPHFGKFKQDGERMVFDPGDRFTNVAEIEFFISDNINSSKGTLTFKIKPPLLNVTTNKAHLVVTNTALTRFDPLPLVQDPIREGLAVESVSPSRYGEWRNDGQTPGYRARSLVTTNEELKFVIRGSHGRLTNVFLDLRLVAPVKKPSIKPDSGMIFHDVTGLPAMPADKTVYAADRELTVGQIRKVVPNFSGSSADAPAIIGHLSIQAIMQICDDLTKMDQGKLPPGYAYALPSSKAQWQFLADGDGWANNLREMAVLGMNSPVPVNNSGRKPNVHELYDVVGNLQELGWDKANSELFYFGGHHKIPVNGIAGTIASTRPWPINVEQRGPVSQVYPVGLRLLLVPAEVAARQRF